MVCRRVHVERPRVSTSGGQSGGMEVVAAVAKGSSLDWGGAIFFPVIAAQSRKLVHERQLDSKRQYFVPQPRYDATSGSGRYSRFTVLIQHHSLRNGLLLLALLYGISPRSLILCSANLGR